MADILASFMQNLRELSRSEATNLYAFLDESSKKLGLKKPVRFVLSESEIPGFFSSFTPKNHANPISSVIITKGSLKLFGDGSLKSVLTDEMKAVIGHELDHIAKESHESIVNKTRIPIFALPIALASGYYILDKAMHKQHEDPEHPLTLGQAIGRVVSDDMIGFKSQPLSNDPTQYKAQMFERVTRWGGTVAMAASGFIAGSLIARHNVRAMEFSADRTSALIAGNIETPIIAIEKVLNAMEKQMGWIKIKKQLNQPSATIDEMLQKFATRIKSYWNAEHQSFQLEVTHAHPSLQERRSSLEKFKQSGEFTKRLEEMSHNTAQIAK